MRIKGIDVSEWQGNINATNWEKAKYDDVNFAILRCGYTGYGVAKKMNVDYYFENNYKMCKKVGIPVGAYYYSCATTVEEAIKEADFVLKIIKGKTFEYPIVIDTEDNHDISKPTNSSTSQASIGKARLTPVIKAFCDKIEEAGYYVSIYASTDWFRNRLILNDLKEYDKWIAQWSNSVSFSSKYGMWQYSSTGKVAGIGSGIDLDYAYLDYPKIMLENGLNGFKKSEPIPDPEPIPTPEPIPDHEPTPDPIPDPEPEVPVKPIGIIKRIILFISMILKWIKKLFKKDEKRS